MDWVVVNSNTMLLLVFLMIMEWSAYSAALSSFGSSAETNWLVFGLKKSCFVPFVSLGITMAWRRVARRRFLVYSQGYTKWTAVCCLSAIVATLCLNVQWILLPEIDDSVLRDFMQDSIIAWALMVVGTFFGLGVWCEGPTENSSDKQVSFQGFTLPVLSAMAIGILGFVVSLLNISFIVPSWFVATMGTVVVCSLIELIRRPSLRRVMRKIQKANRLGYKARKTSGEFKGINYLIDGEWLIIERDKLVKYQGNSAEFDYLFGYQKKQIGTRINQVKSILLSRHEKQIEFVKKENKKAIEFPKEYHSEYERYAKESSN